MSEYMIFCLGDGACESSGDGYQKNYMAWNKSVSKSRYEQILKEVKEILSDFKLDAREDWKEEWQKVRASQWAKLSKISEFDLAITKKITGLSKIDVDEEKTINVEGKTFTVSELKALIASAK